MATGTRYSYTDTGITKRSISDSIFMLDWIKAPLLRILGFGSENVRKFNLVNFPSTKVEWIEDTMSPATSTISEDLDDSETGIDVADGTRFRQGDIVLIDTEKMLVTSVASNTLTVATRPYGSTSAASHSNGATIKIVGRTMPEASGYTLGHSTTTTQGYNYTQILSQAAQVSRTEAKMGSYGVREKLRYQVEKLFTDGGSAGKLPQMLANTFYYGERVQRTSGAYGSMGGFKTFVTTNATNLASKAIVRSDIHSMIRSIRDAGGECDLLITDSWGIEKINQMYEGLIRTTRNETRGGSEITMVKTPHGEVEVVYDWMCPAGDMYFVNSNKCGWLPFDPFQVTEISRQGDYFTRDVVGEFTFALVNEKSHGYIYNISTTK